MGRGLFFWPALVIAGQPSVSELEPKFIGNNGNSTSEYCGASEKGTGYQKGYQKIAAQLGTTGLCVCPGFISARFLHNLADDLDTIRANGGFRQAGIGRGAKHHNDGRVRNDDTFWLDRKLKSAAQSLLWRKLDLLKHAFNRSLFLGVSEFAGHYAAYPEGGYYGRHKDCLRGTSDRIVSLVLYLNRDWKSEDGGQLRVYTPTANGDGTNGESTSRERPYIDVNPVGGTMVCFMSSELEHEVLLSHRQRFSLTGWFTR